MPTIHVRGGDHRELQRIADTIAGAKKVVVVTGAGISTNSGIPDFRSEDGLYSLIQVHYDNAARSHTGQLTPDSTRSNTPAETGSDDAPVSSSRSSLVSNSNGQLALPVNVKGRDLFDALLWNDPLSTSVFYTFIAALRKKVREEVKHTTPTHRFIRGLRDGGRLIRCYTQNIDGLEERDGLCVDLDRGKGNRNRFLKRVVEKPRPEGPSVPGDDHDGGCEVVQLHGDLRSLRCGLCSRLFSWDEDDRELTLLNGTAPTCQVCAEKNDDRRERGKRGTAVGRLRPNVVLYGEEHPLAAQLGPITTCDLRLGPEVMLILGTSLRVHGLKILVKEFAKAVHARRHGQGKVVFVNKTKPPDSVWSDVIDYWVEMDCDAWVHDLHGKRGDIWERQGLLDLPIVKQDAASKEKTKKTSQRGGAVAVARGKENINIHTKMKEAPTDVKKTKTTKKRGPTKRVLMASQKDKARKFPKEVAVKVEGKLDGPSASVSRTLIPPMTPSRKKARESGAVLSPLPTPPRSGAESPSKRGLARRAYEADLVEADMLGSPSKRRREMEVWVDGDGEAA
ncbi:MAG: hypothetical protein M1817_003320 [Caeruleum heppii]|nr:MAG: hypothetical protein M1817_003320 [Caeruleum heppii]